MLAEVSVFPPGESIQEVFFMDEQSPKVIEKKKINFFDKFGWLVAAICGTLAVLFLLGTVVTIKLKIPGEGDEVIKKIIDLHLWDYFQGKYEYDWTMYVTLGLLILGVITSCLEKLKKGFGSASSMLFLLAIPMLALTREFFASNNVEYMSSVTFGWGSNVSIALSICAAVLALSSEFSTNPIVTRQIAEDGILIAAAFILNLIKIPLAAGAGSVNFQMLPLFIIALRHGPSHGLVCGGIIYGLITCLTDGWGFASYPFDYLIGFGSVMVMGYFSKLIFSKKQTWYNVKGEIFLFVGAVIATLIRFIGSTASSMIIYKYTFAAALAYNAIYIPVSGLIAIAVLMAAYGPIAKIQHRYPVKR